MVEDCGNLPDASDASRSWRRISTGKLNLLYSEEKVLPNYLRASTGSCHDVCKYGKRHESEEKARGLALKRVAKKLSPDKIPSQSLDSSSMKSALAKKMPKVYFSNGNCDSGIYDVKSGVRRFPGRTGDAKRREASAAVPTEGLASVNDKNSLKKVVKKTVSSSESRIASLIMRNHKALQCPRTFFVPPGRAPLGSREISEINKRLTLAMLKCVAEKGSAVQRSRKENNAVTRKKIRVLKADPKKAIMPLGASLSRKSFTDRSGSVKVKKGNSLSALPLKNREEVKTAKAENSGLKPRRGKEHEDLVEEKTLYVIKMETENTIVESSQNERCFIDSPAIDSSSPSPPQRLSHREKRQEESESTVTEAEAEDEFSGITEGEGELEEEGESTQVDDEGKDGDDKSLPGGIKVSRQRKNRSFSSEDAMKDKATKLRFKRGKIVDNVPQDNSPRRLKFRRGRVLVKDDITPKSYGKRSFKTKGTYLNNDEHKPRTVKVSLRHQDTQRKKDSRGLFNNVIEETASKLVETRKSKVKALVGAFETVISLQETKPSAT